MATPTLNFVPVTYFDPALLGGGRYVADGEKWGGALGTGVTLTFSFPTLNSYWASPYGSGNEPFNGFKTTTAAEQSAIRVALSTWSRFANISFAETAEVHISGGNVGELRFGFSNSVGSGAAAHAYFPSSNPDAGDVWFSRANFNDDGGSVPLGSYDFLTILHEIGHAIGLKHTFELPNAAPASQDNYFYSIMSYTASPYSAHGDNYASFFPTTPMYLDLLAIEKMYGQRAYNVGNNFYTFNDGVKYWQAINDTAGYDTIVYNGVEGVSISLNPGAFSTLSERITFNGGSSKGTVTIGPNVVIEAVRSGSGNDVLTGNAAANSLNGAAGNDFLRGLAGNDTLTGGPGNDTFVFNTGLSTAANRDIVIGYNPAQDTIHLENAIFTRLPASAHLNPAYFRAAAHALDNSDFIVYNRATGTLMYDPNGNAAGGEVQIAIFSGKPLLTASEFTVI